MGLVITLAERLSFSAALVVVIGLSMRAALDLWSRRMEILSAEMRIRYRARLYRKSGYPKKTALRRATEDVTTISDTDAARPSSTGSLRRIGRTPRRLDPRSRDNPTRPPHRRSHGRGGAGLIRSGMR